MGRDDELAWLSGHEIAARIAGKKLSPVEVTRAALARIARLDPTLHAFVTICADEALEAAREAERAVMRGAALGPLHGVPVAVKDEAWVRGVRATAGSRLFEDFVPSEDGEAIGRLRAAGAILIGKTNVPEFMIWSRTANRLLPETRNPWDLRRSPGASSGGTGAAVAAGLSPLGVGSDGGGSIRIPSAANGLVGLFPTPGRVPDAGSFSYAYCASLGPMARDVRDVALGFAAMSDAKEAFAQFDRGVAGLRFAFTPDYGYIKLQPGLGDVVRGAAHALETAGALVEEPGLVFPNAWEWLGIAIRGHALYSGASRPFTQTEAFGALLAAPENFAKLTEYAQRMAEAPPVSREDYDAAQARTAALKRQFDDLFMRYDAILSPTLPVVAPILPEGLADPYPEFCCGTYFTAVANLAELPAASYPCGILDGMPVGLQIIGPAGREDRVLRICRALEQALPFTAHPALVMA